MTKKTFSKIIVLSKFSLCVQSTTIPGFNLFVINNNNLDNFSKNFSYEPKRCSSTFCFAAHAFSYDILNL